MITWSELSGFSIDFYGSIGNINITTSHTVEFFIAQTTLYTGKYVTMKLYNAYRKNAVDVE